MTPEHRAGAIEALGILKQQIETVRLPLERIPERLRPVGLVEIYDGLIGICDVWIEHYRGGNAEASPRSNQETI